MTVQHWHFNIDSDNIARLIFDRAGKSANTFNDEALNELNSLLDEVAKSKAVGLIISSAKKSGFIAGADLEHAFQVTDQKEALHFLQRGQQVFSKLDDLAIPTVAMISGFCLGGGMELALACDYRIASVTSNTKLGLPEILLGIHPGWGGTIRLTKILPFFTAMNLMLTGRLLSAEEAERRHLIDAAVPLSQLEASAQFFIKTKPRQQSLSFFWKSVFQIKFVFASLLRKQLLKRGVKKELYPAPYALVDAVCQAEFNREKAMEREAQSVATLLLTPTSKNLMRVFFLRELLKESGKQSPFEIKHVHVIGAGTMGGAIAAWCAFRGFKVTLQDTQWTMLAKAKENAGKLFEGKKLKGGALQKTRDHFIIDPEGQGCAEADVVIEAVFERLDVKHAVLKEAEKKLKPGAVLATNTSSIPLEELRRVLKHPENLVGIHFFNPVSKMPLVEIIKAIDSSPDVLQKAFSFVHQIDRLPLPVKSSPGFLVNRILMPYLLESMILLEEGYDKTSIDQAALDFGMPVGPIELADRVGLDVCLHVAKNFETEFKIKIPKTLAELVDKKQLGSKIGKGAEFGFYQYQQGKKIHQKLVESLQAPMIQERLIYKMLNTAVECLDEHLVEDANSLDAGMIFGAGFAPCTGGPIQYINTLGPTHCLERLNMIKHHYDPSFVVSAGWAKKALFATDLMK